MKTDIDIWTLYPQYRLFHNKLWVNELAGNVCGPRGVDVPKPGYYCVRPIYNLCGMGSGAYKIWLEDDTECIPLGYFWTEWLEGKHLSVDYRHKDDRWVVDRCVEGIRLETDPLYKFHKWVKSDCDFKLSKFLHHITVPVLNVEYIGNRVIEIHLRGNPDPDYKELHVVWKSDNINVSKYNFIESIEEFGDDVRLGFFVEKKNYIL
jgi:hypothetical protein